MRRDLIALADADLALLATPGAVRRARREVEEDGLRADLDEDAAGTLTARWSDGPVCVLAADRTLGEGCCTCAAVGAGPCRHLLRTAILYRQRHAGAGRAPAWDPGAIDDAALAAAWGAAALRGARADLAAGTLAEAVRSRKPHLRLIGSGRSVRFLVPGDPRYVSADLAGAARARLVCAAVLLFRRLPPGCAAGVVASGGAAADPAHTDRLAEALAWIDEVLLVGAAGATAAVPGQGRALAERLAAAGLPALAALLAEAAADLDRYRRRDALFAPEQLLARLGEAQVRAAVLRQPPPGIPLPLVRGAAPGRGGERASGAFIGIGCLGRVGHRGLALSAIMQDAATGSPVAITCAQADAADGAQADARTLARRPLATGPALRDLAHGALRSAACRRCADGGLALGRGRHTVDPPDYAWESLREPLLVEDFAELRDRLLALPPACLRAPGPAGDVHVLRVRDAGPAAWDPVAQAWRWTIADADGATCTCAHVHRTRAAAGTAALTRALGAGHPQRFVSLAMRPLAGALTGSVLAVVFDGPAGRYAVMPWCDSPADLPADLAAAADPATAAAGDAPPPPLDILAQELCTGLVNGLERADRLWGDSLADAAWRLAAAGYEHLAGLVADLGAAVQRQAGTEDGAPTPAELLPHLRDLAIWYRLGLDVGG